MRQVVLLLITSLGLLISGHGRAQREPVRTYVDEPIVGWHWYNEPQKQDEKETPPPATVPLTSLPPTTQMKVLQRMTEERLNTAILYPTVENFTAYMKMQNFWTSQASRCSCRLTRTVRWLPFVSWPVSTGCSSFTGGMMHWMVSLQRWCSVSLTNTTLR